MPDHNNSSNFAPGKITISSMKIKSVLMMLSAAVFMMACDKDENGSKTVDFAGRYNGYTLASCNYFQNMISADETVVITENTALR